MHLFLFVFDPRRRWWLNERFNGKSIKVHSIRRHFGPMKLCFYQLRPFINFHAFILFYLEGYFAEFIYDFVSLFLPLEIPPKLY